jgi:hypothetical protein
MKVLIRVDRVAAILAGCDCYGDLIADINPADFNLDERHALAQAPENQGITDLTAPFPLPGQYPAPPETAMPDVRAWLRWRMKCQKIHQRTLAHYQAQQDQIVQHYIDYWLQQPLEHFVVKQWPAIDFSVMLPSGHPGRDEAVLPDADQDELMERIYTALASKLAEAQLLAEQWNQQAFKNRQEEEAHRQQTLVRRAQQLAQWVENNMDENAQARFKLHLLSEDEILDAMRDRIYQAFDDLQRYRKIRFEDLQHHAYCQKPCGLDCETDEANYLTAAQFEIYQHIQQRLPKGAQIKPLIHSCACERCHVGLIRRGVQVMIPFGEFVFSREYALDGN